MACRVACPLLAKADVLAKESKTLARADKHSSARALNLLTPLRDQQ